MIENIDCVYQDVYTKNDDDVNKKIIELCEVFLDEDIVAIANKFKNETNFYLCKNATAALKKLYDSRFFLTKVNNRFFRLI